MLSQFSTFKQIKLRLLFSYLTVLISILGVFTLAIRIFFIRNLSYQLSQKLGTLANAAASVEEVNGKFKVSQDFSPRILNERYQALQWYDLQGNLIAQRGDHVIAQPFAANQFRQYQSGEHPIEALTIPIFSRTDNQLHGYVRASQSLDELHQTVEKLDWGVGSGILVALVLSTLGGVWLTNKNMETVEASFDRLRQFTADASHELRSPLMAIKSNVEVSLKYSDGMRSEDYESFIAVSSATNQMTRLTEDLLFLARTEEMPNRDWQSLNLTSILEELVQLYKPQAIAKQIDFQAQLQNNLSLMGDAAQLRRLFTNLMINALKFTPPEGKIVVLASQSGTYIQVQVQDSGIGIATEHIEHIFERFWQVDQARSQEMIETGSGLGLAIAQAITQTHGGKITVTSDLGVGSCFTVRLPRRYML